MRLITHLRPHLDDACAVWLMRRYLPAAKDAPVEFVTTGTVGTDDPETVMIGVGRGRFDEHKGDLDDCAATLVLKHLKGGSFIPAADLPAIERLVGWVKEEDLGLLNKVERREFTVPIILENFYDHAGGDSGRQIGLAFDLLDALLLAQKNQVTLDEDWEKRVEFGSVFGPAVALKSDARSIDAFAYARGFDLVVWVNKKRSYHNIRAAASSRIDLTPVYQELRRVDNQADWFFHHSKKMLICGSELDPKARPSKLSLEWLIDLLTPNYVRKRSF